MSIIMIPTNLSECVSHVDFEAIMKSIDQKFDELTETMISQFDRMYIYMNGRFAEIDRRFDDFENRMNHKFDLLFKHFGIVEKS